MPRGPRASRVSRFACPLAARGNHYTSRVVRAAVRRVIAALGLRRLSPATIPVFIVTGGGVLLATRQPPPESDGIVWLGLWHAVTVLSVALVVWGVAYLLALVANGIGYDSFAPLSLALSVATAGCATPAATPFPPPSEAEARQLLSQVVDRVVGGRVDSVCELASGTCPAELRETDPATFPRVGPTVLGSEAIQPSIRSDGNWDLGGLILKLCGRDGEDNPYYSEMLVFRDPQRGLIAINALYWLGSRVARSPVVPAPGEVPACPA